MVAVEPVGRPGGSPVQTDLREIWKIPQNAAPLVSADTIYRIGSGHGRDDGEEGRREACSSGLPIGRDGRSSWRKKKPGGSITTTSALANPLAEMWTALDRRELKRREAA